MIEVEVLFIFAQKPAAKRLNYQFRFNYSITQLQ